MTTKQWSVSVPMLTNTRIYICNSAVNTGSAIYVFGGINISSSSTERYSSTYERFDLTSKETFMGQTFRTLQRTVAACFDGVRYIYMHSESQFIRVSIKSREIKKLQPHPSSSDDTGIQYIQHSMVYSLADKRIHTIINGSSHQYDTATDQWVNTPDMDSVSLFSAIVIT
eukprot:gene7293-8480_t